MKHTRENVGTCSVQTTVEIENGIIKDIEILRGCDGNIKGVCALSKGKPATEIIGTLKNITCGNKTTSCPAQLAICLEEALAIENQ